MIKKVAAAIIIFIISFGTPYQGYATRNKFLYSVESNSSYSETVQKLESELKKRKLTLFSEFLFYNIAKKHNTLMRPTVVLAFGDDNDIMRLIEINQSIAIDLPLKIMVWENSSGAVMIGYIKFSYISKKYNLSTNPITLKMDKLLYEITHTVAK